MGTFKEFFINESVNKKEFIDFVVDYINSKDGFSIKDEGDKYTIMYNSTNNKIMELNKKSGNLKIIVPKADKKLYDIANKLLEYMQVDYWREYGVIEDKNTIRKILKNAGITDIEDGRMGLLFKTNDGQWYQIFKTGAIEKYDAKKNIDPKTKKRIRDEWKKEKPNLKWYFKEHKVS
jgi:hypothetical protein